MTDMTFQQAFDRATGAQETARHLLEDAELIAGKAHAIRTGDLAAVVRGLLMLLEDEVKRTEARLDQVSLFVDEGYGDRPYYTTHIDETEGI